MEIKKNYMKTFTLKEVEVLLKTQRENCYKSSKIEEFEYVNIYSSRDGEITRRISKESILSAKSPLD